MSATSASHPETSADRLRRHVGELLRLSAPIIVARAGVLTLAMADTAFVGHFSAQELAYQAIALAPTGAVLVAGLGLLLGTAVMTANAFGRRAYAECGAVWRRSLPFALVIGLIGAILCAFGEPFLRLTGQAPDIARGGGEVMLVIGLGLPFALLHIATSFFLEGIKRPLPGMVLMIAANLVNILLNWVLVYGQFGLPALGAVGSAWATTAVRVFLGLGAVAYVWTMRDRDRFAIRLRPTGGWRSWAAMRRIGYAAGASVGVESAAFAALSLFAGLLGPLPLGAYSIGLNLLAFVFMIAIGIGAATAVRVGIAHGRHDTREVAWAGWAGLGVNSVAMLLLGLLFLTAPGLVARIYTTDPALLAQTTPLIAFAAFILLVDGGQGVMANALRGRGDAWLPTVGHVFAYCGVMIPAGWLLAFRLERGAQGLFEAILIASIVAFGLLCARFGWLAARDAAGVVRTCNI